MNCKTVCFLKSLLRNLAQPTKAARRYFRVLPQPGGCLRLCWPIKLGQDEWFFCCLFPLFGRLCLSATHITCCQMKQFPVVRLPRRQFLDWWPDIGVFSSDGSVSAVSWITWTRFFNYDPELTTVITSFYFNPISHNSNITLSACSAV